MALFSQNTSNETLEHRPEGALARGPKHVLVLCGGISPEAEFSFQSLHFVLTNMPPENRITLVAIDPQGSWHYLCPPQHQSWRSLAENTAPGETWKALMQGVERIPVWILPRGPHVFMHPLYPLKVGLDHHAAVFAHPLDVAFPVLHGFGGEDGVIQGLFQSMGLPYVGCPLMACALGMDKALARQVLKAQGIACVPFLSLHKSQQHAFSYAQACAHFSLIGPSPNLMLKSQSMGGSSFYAFPVCDAQGYGQALESLFAQENWALVEPFLSPIQELECAVFGGPHLHVSGVGEIRLISETYYSLEAKRHSHTVSVEVEANIDQDLQEHIQGVSKTIFRALQAWGLARVDFFLHKDLGLIFNEINTLPGLTGTSLYPKLMAQAGLDPHQLIEGLINLAFEAPWLAGWPRRKKVTPEILK